MTTRLAYDDPWPLDRPLDANAAGWLRDVAGGGITYDRANYPNHGVPNNVVALCWHDLVTHGPDGLTLTDRGHAVLRLSPVADDGPDPDPEPTPTASQATTAPAAGEPAEQAALF